MQNMKINKIIDLFLKNVLVYMIYMVEHDDTVNFIYVSDDEADNDIISELEIQLSDSLCKEVNILNICDFSIPDRVDVIKRAELIYSGDAIMKRMFEFEINAAFKAQLNERLSYIERKEKCGAYYLQ